MSQEEGVSAKKTGRKGRMENGLNEKRMVANRFHCVFSSLVVSSGDGLMVVFVVVFCGGDVSVVVVLLRCGLLLWCFCLRVLLWCFCFGAVVVFELSFWTAHVALWRCLWSGLNFVVFFAVPVALLLCYIGSRRVMSVNIGCRSTKVSPFVV